MGGDGLARPKLRSAASGGLDSSFALHEAGRVFGRPSEWSNSAPPDLESGLGALLWRSLTSSLHTGSGSAGFHERPACMVGCSRMRCRSAVRTGSC